MKFFKFFQDNRLFVHYLTFVIIIVGVMSLTNMRREARPNVDFHRLAISAAFPGASPGDIEELVIDPIEEKIAEVDGVEEYRSVSFSGAGSITVKIDDEYPNPGEVADEVRRKLAEVNDLPSEVKDPTVREIKAINIPMLRIALYGNLPPLKMKLEVEKLKDYLRTFEGVQSVSYSGLEDLQLKIATQPDKLDENDLTLMEIMTRLGQWSKQRPGGQIENLEQTANVTVGYDYNDIEKLENFVLRSNDSGQAVRLGDVSKIEYATKESQVQSLYGDKTAVLITIVKKPFADIVESVDLVKAGVEKYSRSLPPELSYKFYSDQATRVRNRLSTVAQNAIFGLILVLTLLIVFLDWRSAIVASIGIPVAILGGIILIYQMGHTMNSLVLVGMVIVLGMLVDDAIVVCENIYAYVEKGMSPVQAALTGVKEISTPVIATVMTTVFAFFPILFMKEIMGQFLRVIPLTVIAMLAVSLFEALVILPVHSAELMKVQKKKKPSFFKKVEEAYRKYLTWSIKYRTVVIVAMGLFIVASGMQGRQLFKRFTLFPATGLEGLSVRLELPKNTPLPKTTEAVQELSRRMEKVSQGTFETFFASVGQVTTGGASGSRQTASHLGSVTVNFTSDPNFINIEKEILRSVRQVIGKYTKETGYITSLTIDRPGPPVGKPIQLQVTSRDLEFGQSIVDKLKGKFSEMKGVHSLETDLDGDSVKYRFVVDNDLAVADGINPSDISSTIFASSTGRVTSEILKNNEKVEILVTLDDGGDLKIPQILALKVRNNRNQAVPIASYVKVVQERGPSSIQRYNGLRTITLFGEVDEKIITGKEANAAIRPFIGELRAENPTVKIATRGGERDRMRALSDTGRLYLLALLLIFMVISLSFRSVIYPFLVLLAIPLGVCGVVWSLVAHGKPLSLMGIIGVVGLSGVVVNVSIILMAFVKDRLESGMGLKEAVIDAGVRRLRPILITSVTTLIGLAPTIYGIGGTDTFVQPLALVLGWGLFVATALTLFALPALLSHCTILEKD